MTTHPIGMAAILLTTLAPGDPSRMRAIVHHEYGSPEVLRLEAVDKPVPTDDQILIRVHAASINPLDWHYLRGTPYLMRLDAGLRRPNSPRRGVDFAGTVEAVGRSVTGFKPGDEVFGGKSGALAEFVCTSPRAVVAKPANLTFQQAASVPIAAVTALQGLRDSGKLQPGQKVLINGASGGVGTFAVQIAKVLGAEVTGVCSTSKLDLVRSIGADHVIDYTQEDFTAGEKRYDLVLDNVLRHSLSELLRALDRKGTLVPNGGQFYKRWFASTGVLLVKAPLLSVFVPQRIRVCNERPGQDDLLVLKELMESGKLTPVVDRTYPLSRTREAISHFGEGHAEGKVVITI